MKAWEILGFGAAEARCAGAKSLDTTRQQLCAEDGHAVPSVSEYGASGETLYDGCATCRRQMRPKPAAKIRAGWNTVKKPKAPKPSKPPPKPRQPKIIHTKPTIGAAPKPPGGRNTAP